MPCRSFRALESLLHIIEPRCQKEAPEALELATLHKERNVLKF